MFNGFETKSNTLSIYSFSNETEKNRLIVNFDICKNKCLSISQEILYVEFSSDFLTLLGLKSEPSIITEYFDQLAYDNHHNITNLTSSSLIRFITKINNELEKPINLTFSTIKRPELREIIQSSFNDNHITWKRDPYLLADYKNKAFNQ